jgi:hypothetical protein
LEKQTIRLCEWERFGQEQEKVSEQIHAEPYAIPVRGVGIEVDLPGDSQSIEEVDDADRGLESGAQPLRHRLRGPTTELNWQSPFPSGLTQDRFQGRSKCQNNLPSSSAEMPGPLSSISNPSCQRSWSNSDQGKSRSMALSRSLE